MEYAFQESPKKKPKKGPLAELRNGVKIRQEIQEFAKGLGALFAGNKEKSNPSPSPPQIQTPANKPAFIPSARRSDDQPKNIPTQKQFNSLSPEEIADSETELGEKTAFARRVVRDHRENLKNINILGKEAQLNFFLNHYEKYRARYDQVSRATGVPSILIACIHKMESDGMSFNTYLHNGDPLGKPTKHHPPGILFDKDQWAEAAIHALGGNIKDSNGKPSLGYFRSMRIKFGINSNTNDIAKMMGFAESFNGFGRGKSLYIYGGTDQAEIGGYDRDGHYNKNRVGKRSGVAAMLLYAQGKYKLRPKEPKNKPSNYPRREYDRPEIQVSRKHYQKWETNGPLIPEKQLENKWSFNRVLKYPVSSEAQSIVKEVRTQEKVITFTYNTYYKHKGSNKITYRKPNQDEIKDYKTVDRQGELKESAMKAFQIAHKLAEEHGFHLVIFSDYRDPNRQKNLGEANVYLAGPGRSWHQSAGTLDVRLVDDQGNHLTMYGSRMMKRYFRLKERFEKMDRLKILNLNRGEKKKYQQYLKLKEKAKKNELLLKIMNEAGFVNLSSESWHFEFGSEYWYKIMQDKKYLAANQDFYGTIYARHQPGHSSPHEHVHEEDLVA